MIDAIVVGVDGSDASDRALQMACAMAKVHQAEMHIVHSPEINTVEAFATIGGPVMGPSRAQVMEAGTRVMTKAKEMASAAGVTPASCTLGEDGPCAEIMTIVDLYDADLVVTGRRGLGAVSGMFMGSQSQKLAHLLDCAFLTVK